MIEERFVEKTRERVLQPAHYKEVPSGNYREAKIFKEDGTVETEQRPIVDRVFVEAIKDTVIDRTQVFTYNDGIDNHDFATREEAEKFLKEQRRYK